MSVGDDPLAAVAITSADGGTTAEFVPAANMLCRSLRDHGVELLDAGHGVAAYAQRGKTMGIPLLYPWANRLSRRGYRVAGREVTLPEPAGRYALDPAGLPIHGALPGDLRWEAAPAASGDRLMARLPWAGRSLLELFPYAHELELAAWVGDGELALETIVRATGSDAVPVSFGYHPYLTLPGSERRGWRVALGATQRLVLDERLIPTGAREPLPESSFTLGEQSWDDGLDGLSSPPRFAVSGGGRTLTMTFEAGYRFAQVYAPPGHDFICFEPMTAPTDALNSGDDLVLVAPGDDYRARFRVSVGPQVS